MSRLEMAHPGVSRAGFRQASERAEFVAYATIAVVRSAALLVSAAGKLRKMEQVVTMITGLGVPLAWFPRLAAAEIAGAVVLLVALAVPAIGILAAVGVIAYFVGAVVAHLRAGDRQILPPAVLGVLGVVTLVLRIGASEIADAARVGRRTPLLALGGYQCGHGPGAGLASAHRSSAVAELETSDPSGHHDSSTNSAAGYPRSARPAHTGRAVDGWHPSTYDVSAVVSGRGGTWATRVVDRLRGAAPVRGRATPAAMWTRRR